METTTTSRQRFTGTFTWLVIAAGAAVCLFSLYEVRDYHLARPDLSFLVLALLTSVIGSRVAVVIPRIGGQITVSDTFIFLAVLLYGGEAAVMLAALDGICASIRISRKLRTYLFNSSVLACSTFLTVWTLRLCFGPIDELPRHNISAAFITAICVMALVQYVSNSGLVAVLQSLKIDQPFWQTWRRYYLWSSVTYFAGASAAGIVSKLVSSVGFYGVMATAPIIAIVYVTYSTYLKNIEASARQAELAEQHVEELSRYITEQERIREQYAQIEKLSALGELASGVAHDFNNTLAGIMGRAQLLLMRTQDPEVIRCLRIIVKSAHDGSHTVKRIQDFARQRRDKNFELVAIDQLLPEIIEITRPRWKDSAENENVHIKFASRISTNAYIMGDESELREVFINMIFNAVDAMPQGGTITLSAEEAGDSVSISISDTGAGMSPEVRSRIFDPFFTTKGKAGLGLGLAVSYGIISRHEGTINVESEVGCGTTFCIALPMADAEAQAAGEVKLIPEPPAPLSLPVRARKLRILVVDDEEPLREILRELLEHHGHEVRLAEGGYQALELFDAETFDAIFTDIGMPEMNGWELARSIRARDARIPIAAITGWGNAVREQEQSAAGVNWVVTKPFVADRIVELVHDVSRYLSESDESASAIAAA
jgi:signal transduction histidine kinase/ActR/RegA family two-component response regulator